LEARNLLTATLAQSSPGRPFEYATLLHTLGNATEKTGDLTGARNYYSQALAIDRKEGYVRFIASDLDALGSVCMALGDHESAADYLYRSLKIRTLLSDGEGAEETSKNLKSCLEHLGSTNRPPQATEFFLKRWAESRKTAMACE
jgi:tetratricopeptide (TPR) repeat protein